MKAIGHTHNFINTYLGLVGFGLDRETDEKSLMVYLQKFSDDAFLEALVPRLNAVEIEEIIGLIHRLLKTHLQENEYHHLFLKDDVEDHEVNL
ncbi:MAG: cytoplasmic protein [Thermodesulfobacteriota bacterium]